jgi:hypothetical protein
MLTKPNKEVTNKPTTDNFNIIVYIELMQQKQKGNRKINFILQKHTIQHVKQAVRK